MIHLQLCYGRDRFFWQLKNGPTVLAQSPNQHANRYNALKSARNFAATWAVETGVSLQIRKEK